MHPSTGRRVSMSMDPASVARLARDWDEQHDDLRVASGLLADAPTAGFTPPVARAAADFLRVWSGHVGSLAQLSAHQSRDLTAVLGAWLRADEQAADRGLRLAEQVEQVEQVEQIGHRGSDA